ncbi:HAMP domain-containing histidine kinase [Paucibacter sp. DJ1R-11]|uniref:sensor histidine kinase n=1 Tax=Paucibacter sp. DJ1R-11 TaxID=2893556 RepID=UPI0021E46794|nr:HAMP domain-containing sensor histidine kinase [Paucibacter sp. DJ1R-11]MCV2364090.1 HAMP domain-containing histidine kinase [Paucibacter sp. DJ1R-11]
MSDSDRLGMPNPAPLSEGCAIAQTLEQARGHATSFEQSFFSDRLSLLQGQVLTAEQALELEAFRVLALATAPEVEAQDLLLKGRDLLGLAQTHGFKLAEAACWRAIQWVQTRLKLHHAALESVAHAMDLYEQAERLDLAQLMRVARCPVLFMAEMYPELRQTSAELLEQHAELPPPLRQLVLNNAASAAYYLANEEVDPGQARCFWEECLALHQESLRLTQAHGLAYAELVAHLNLAVVHATLGHGSACREHLSQLHAQAGAGPLQQASWLLWERLCGVLLRCREGSRDEAWHALLALDAELAKAPVVSVGHRDAVLHALRYFGERWGFMDQALRASLTQLQQERERKREMSRALGETVHAVMERPRLLQANELLSRHGSELEQSLAQRNQELSHALAKVQAEASIRAAAEAALKRAHDDLEAQVQQRTAELEVALRTLMQQEKQLALSRMVVGVAHEMNTPLGNARMAASTMQDQCQALRQQARDGQLRRSDLDQSLARLQEGSAMVDRGLARAAQLVERFKALAISQHQEVTQDFDLAAQLRDWVEVWRGRLPGAGFQLELCGLPPALPWHGHRRALHEVLEQLFDNSIQHAWSGRSAGRIVVKLGLKSGEPLLGLDWQDDGPGIPSEHLPHVLEPFFSARLGQGGSGLGLSTAHSLVCALMGGRMAVHSEAGQGCRVAIELPAHPDCAEGAAPSQQMPLRESQPRI